jgi:hypothetical protein
MVLILDFIGYCYVFCLAAVAQVWKLESEMRGAFIQYY